MTIMGLNYLQHLETQRSNVAREAETNRHNVETEGLGKLQFGETVRSNLVNERIKQGTLDESVRSNKSNEGIKRDTLTETKRSNQANEKLKEYANVTQRTLGFSNLAEEVRSNKTKEAETLRSNLARETETNRTNAENERIKVYTNDTNIMSKSMPWATVQELESYDKMFSTGQKVGNTFDAFITKFVNAFGIGVTAK